MEARTFRKETFHAGRAKKAPFSERPFAAFKAMPESPVERD
jgi:hypothetical protein